MASILRQAARRSTRAAVQGVHKACVRPFTVSTVRAAQAQQQVAGTWNVSPSDYIGVWQRQTQAHAARALTPSPHLKVRIHTITKRTFASNQRPVTLPQTYSKRPNSTPSDASTATSTSTSAPNPHSPPANPTSTDTSFSAASPPQPPPLDVDSPTPERNTNLFARLFPAPPKPQSASGSSHGSSGSGSEEEGPYWNDRRRKLLKIICWAWPPMLLSGYILYKRYLGSEEQHARHEARRRSEAMRRQGKGMQMDPDAAETETQKEFKRIKAQREKERKEKDEREIRERVERRKRELAEQERLRQQQQQQQQDKQ